LPTPLSAALFSFVFAFLALSLSLRVSGSSKWASKTKSKNAATTTATVRSPRNKTTNITNLNYLLSQQKKSISVLKKDVAAA